MGSLRVAELFAGVGGFRIGLERAGAFQVVWSNQWEPGRRKQHASEVYTARFGTEHHVCSDIATVPTSDIPDHDLLVGGFPCQDYSVASTLKNAKGLVGRKGVLWWQIHRILDQKKHKPRWLLLENVDRLLGSPAGQRGRDFAVMLASLNALGYTVEWRVINAAEHGMPQRRRRVFIFGERGVRMPGPRFDAHEYLLKEGLFACAFPRAEAVGD
ncbi:MAG TPA: DNA (cytosine-5-)-methyltransferase, partial [Flavobacteriales bacterium]|nr:DNA (cytosine-5-)-methyltransferase [Flavobacteriales bacterium]